MKSTSRSTSEPDLSLPARPSRKAGGGRVVLRHECPDRLPCCSFRSDGLPTRARSIRSRASDVGTRRQFSYDADRCGGDTPAARTICDWLGPIARRSARVSTPSAYAGIVASDVPCRATDSWLGSKFTAVQAECASAGVVIPRQPGWLRTRAPSCCSGGRPQGQRSSLGTTRGEQKWPNAPWTRRSKTSSPTRLGPVPHAGEPREEHRDRGGGAARVLPVGRRDPTSGKSRRSSQTC